MDIWYNLQKTADILGLSRPTVKRLFDKGDIPYTKFNSVGDISNGHYRVKKSDIDRFMNRTIEKKLNKELP
jgi:excisionase family DNA binding protein